MGVRSKTLITVLLVGTVVGVLVLQTENKNLFKGQIFDQNSEKTQNEKETSSLKPDLKPELELILPETEDQDITANVTLQNIGEGSIAGGKPFKYAIYINETEIFSNSDSYSELGPGDSFSFKYPVSKTIYQYPNKGTVTVKLDAENAITESDENNNIAEKEYNLE